MVGVGEYIFTGQLSFYHWVESGIGKFVICHWVEVEEYLFRGHLFGSGWVRLQSVIDYWRRVGEYFIICQFLICG